MPTDEGEARGSRAREGLLLLVLWGAAWAFLAATCDPPMAHLDTARDGLEARELLAGAGPSTGPGASVPGFVHGLLWIRFVALGLRLGLGVTALQQLVLALQALGAVLVAATAGRLAGGRRTAMLLALSYSVLLRAVDAGDILWNPSLAHPAAALFAFGALATVAGGGPAMALAAGAGAGLALSAHALGLVLVPILAGLLLLAPREPLARLLLGAGAFLAVVSLDSWEGFATNLDALVASGLGAWAAGSLLLAPLAALGLRRAGRSLSGVGLGAAAAWGTTALLALATAAAPRVAGAVDASAGRYAIFLPPFLAVSLALAASALLERLPLRSDGRRTALAAGAAGLLLVLSLASWRSHDGNEAAAPWRWREVERIGEDLYGRGASYASLFRGLRGQGDRSLLAALAALEPEPRDSRRSGDDGMERTVLRFERTWVPMELPSGWREVELGGRFVALLRERREESLPARFEACEADEPDAPCLSAERRWEEPEAGPGGLRGRLYPGVRFGSGGGVAGPRRTSWAWKLPPSPTARIAFLVTPEWEGVHWELALDGRKAGRKVDLPPGDVSRRLVARPVGAPRPGSDAAWPPPVVVGEADDPVLRMFLVLPGASAVR